MDSNKQSMEDYLERMLMLKDEGVEKLHAIQLANSFSYSKASISIALKKLEQKKYITIDDKNIISLTETGEKIARETYDRHKTIGKFLTSLGVDEKTAYDDACKIEHDISEQTFIAIKNYINKN